MKRLSISLIATSMALLSAVAVADRLQSRMLEQSVETQSDLIKLPGDQGGLLMVRSCETCELRTLRMDAGTQFYVGSTKMTLIKMTQYLQGARKATAGVVAYRTSDQIVSRVSVSTVASK